MRPIKVLTLVGGISRGSLNKKYYRSILDLNPEGFHFETFDISRLPFFSQDIEHDPPDAVTEFKEHIREADAILFITPEYNSSIPGVLKNSLDWGSRPYGESVWGKKPAAILGASPGNGGTFGAQNHLRQMLAYLDMRTMGQPQIYFGQADKSFNEEGKLTNEKTKNLLMKFFKTFHEWVVDVSTEDFSEPLHQEKSQGLEDNPLH